MGRSDDSRFWKDEQSDPIDSQPWNRSGHFSALIQTISATPPRDGDGRGISNQLADAPGRWSNCVVYLDVPTGMANTEGNLDDVQFTLWSRSQGVAAIVAQANVSAMNLEPNVGASRLRGIGLVAEGCAGVSFFVTATSKTDFKGTRDAPVGRITMEVWGTEGSFGGAQGALGAALDHGGIRDLPVIMRGAEMCGWNDVNGRWYPVAVDASGNLSVAVTVNPPTPVTPTRVVDAGGRNAFAGVKVIQAVVPTNKSGATLFFQIFDTAAAPSSGVPLYSIAVPDGATVPLGSTVFNSDKLLTGFGFCWSTTDQTCTPVGSSAGLFVTILTT